MESCVESSSFLRVPSVCTDKVMLGTVHECILPSVPVLGFRHSSVGRTLSDSGRKTNTVRHRFDRKLPIFIQARYTGQSCSQHECSLPACSEQTLVQVGASLRPEISKSYVTNAQQWVHPLETSLRRQSAATRARNNAPSARHPSRL